MGLVTRQIQHVPHAEPPRVVIKSANPAYKSYERLAGEIHIVGLPSGSRCGSEMPREGCEAMRCRHYRRLGGLIATAVERLSRVAAAGMPGIHTLQTEHCSRSCFRYRTGTGTIWQSRPDRRVTRWDS